MARDDSRWWDFYPPSGPKLPPPEHGIRVAKIGATWWGERWVEALARLGESYAARLRRGRGYARQGRVHDLAVAGGEVTASVTGSRPTPYRVTLTLRPLPDRAWDRATRAMAEKARFAAALLGGEMPREIDEAFAAAGGSLFPARRADLRAACTCPDDANPCKHIAAVHYVLGEAFDRDPFLLFELRG
ncbi:MAG: SWIM zinc finger family protein, partial [Candidatus Rokuibacteriota bacterium]